MTKTYLVRNIENMLSYNIIEKVDEFNSGKLDEF